MERFTSKEKAYAVVVDIYSGPQIKRVKQHELDYFTHDVVEGYFEALPVSDISTIGNLILLVNDAGLLEGLQLNPWATMIFRNDRPIDTNLYIFGNAVLLRKNGVELEPFTKDEAFELVVAMRA